MENLPHSVIGLSSNTKVGRVVTSKIFGQDQHFQNNKVLILRGKTHDGKSVAKDERLSTSQMNGGFVDPLNFENGKDEFDFE